MKKTLAIILTLALVICMMPASAFAEDSNPTTTDTYNLANATISLSQNQYTYDGTAKVPTVTVTDSSGKTVGTDKYTVSYVNNTDASSNAQVTVNGKTSSVEGNQPTDYYGVKTANFTINQLDINKDVNVSVASDILDTDFDNSSNLTDNGKNKVNIKVGNVDVKSILSVTYTLAKNNSKQDVLRVDVKPGSNQNVISTTGISPEFVLKKDISTGYTILLNSGSNTPTYTGTEIKPSVIVKKTSDNSTLGTNEYTVSYSNNINAGSATVTIVATGANYVGRFSASPFTIQQKSIADRDVAVVTTSAAAAGQKPTVTVTYNGKTLTEDLSPGRNQQNTDYYIESYGNGKVTIAGKGNFNGTRVENYKLVDKTITSATVNATTTYYNGSTQQATLTVKGSDGKILNSYDYKVTYSYTDKKTGKTVTTDYPKEAYPYTVTVSGTPNGNYGGNQIHAGVFQILPIPLDWTEIVLGSATVYDTSSRTYVPKVTLRTKSGYTYGYTGNVIIPETDYNVSYRWVNSTSAYLRPTAVVTKAAKAVNLANATNQNITEITKEFNTATKNLAYCTASFTDGRSSSAYTGSAVTPKVTVRDGYTTLDPSTYTVTYKNASGKVVSSMRDAGTYTVVIKGNGAYYGELTLTYTITGTDIGNYTVTLKESSVTADGRTKTPVITSVSYGYYSKLSSSDYTVSYQDSTGKEVKSYQMSTPGTYKVVVTGKNGYTGSCYATFTIVGLSQSITGVDGSYKVYPTSETFRLYPKATEGRFTYTSSNPSVASVDAFGNVTPYKAGRAKITISTTGNVRYNPVTTSTVIKVYPNKAAMTRKPWTAGKGKIKARWNKQDNVTRYEVRYSKNKSFKKGTYKTKKVNAAVNAYTTQSTTLSGLNSGYTYYVKVRAVKEVYNDYGKKLTYYGKWSGWRSVRVK